MNFGNPEKPNIGENSMPAGNPQNVRSPKPQNPLGDLSEIGSPGSCQTTPRGATRNPGTSTSGNTVPWGVQNQTDHFVKGSG